MARSRWKLGFFSDSIWRKIICYKKHTLVRLYNKNHYIYERSSLIPNCFMFYSLKIHKGVLARRLGVTPIMQGCKFGEFSFTRKPYHFPLRKKKKKKIIFLN